MKAVLLAAAGYNLAWGLWAGLFPNRLFELAGAQPPNYPEIVQCGGLFIAVWGIGYAIAAFDPLRHWPIVFVGFLAKVFASLGFLWAAGEGRLPADLGWAVVFNDVVWLVPFGIILYRAYDDAIGRKRVVSPDVRRMALRTKTNMGMTLDELSRLSPVLLVFLRQLGCTFCREALADLARNRHEIEKSGARIVLIHMSCEENAAEAAARYGLAHAGRVSDPTQSVYKAFGLSRGRFPALFGPKVWWRGLQAAICSGNAIGAPDGDGFQMPGVFLIFHGEVLRSYIHQSAADRPNYVQLASGEPSRTRTPA